MLILSVGVASRTGRSQPRLNPTRFLHHVFRLSSAVPQPLRIWVDKGSLEPPAPSLAGSAPLDIVEGYDFLQANVKLSFGQRSR